MYGPRVMTFIHSLITMRAHNPSNLIIADMVKAVGVRPHSRLIHPDDKNETRNTKNGEHAGEISPIV